MRHPIVVDTGNALVDRRPGGNQLILFTLGATHRDGPGA
jgi:hypothetical protein